MRVTLFQYDVFWMNPEENLNAIDLLCKKISSTTDMVILPEMFNTGYTMQPGLVPAQWQEDTIQHLQNLSEKYMLSFAGTIPFFKDNQYVNSFIFVTKQGLHASYDKVHLFTLAGEKKVYSPGNQFTCFKYHEYTIQPLICYDLRFPYASYQNVQKDVLIYSANWPSSRLSHWKTLLKARAIENQCFVIGVNRTGNDQNGYEYPGSSMLIDFNGDTIIEMSDKPEYQTATLDFEAQIRYRKKLPFLSDSRYEEIANLNKEKEK